MLFTSVSSHCEVFLFYRDSGNSIGSWVNCSPKVDSICGLNNYLLITFNEYCVDTSFTIALQARITKAQKN